MTGLIHWVKVAKPVVVTRGLGGVVIFRGDAETADLPYPNRRNKGLKPLVPHDPLTADLGFRVQRRQALSPLLLNDQVTVTAM